MGDADEVEIDRLVVAAETGDSGAMLRLAKAKATNGDIELSRRWFERAAEEGSTEAKVALGKLLLDREPLSAWRWIEQAADEGHWWAVGRVAQRFLRRHPTSQSRHSRHHGELMRLLQAGAERQDPFSMRTYGHRLEAEGKHDEAREWLRKAAAVGDTDAANYLAALDVLDNPTFRHRDLVPTLVWMAKRMSHYGIERVREVFGRG